MMCGLYSPSPASDRDSQGAACWNPIKQVHHANAYGDELKGSISFINLIYHLN